MRLYEFDDVGKGGGVLVAVGVGAGVLAGDNSGNSIEAAADSLSGSNVGEAVTAARGVLADIGVPAVSAACVVIATRVLYCSSNGDSADTGVSVGSGVGLAVGSTP